MVAHRDEISRIQRYLLNHDLVERLKLQLPLRVTFLAQGEYNQNFLLSGRKQQYVFRINRGSQINVKSQIRYEYNALKFLERSKMTPKVYYVDDRKADLPYGILIMQYLSGRPLHYDTDMTLAARALGWIHQLPVTTEAHHQLIAETDNILEARIEECRQLLAPVKESPYVPEESKDLLKRAFKSCQNHVEQGQSFFDKVGLWRINNTELNSHNFIVGHQGWVIDWEKPVISHPVQDISQFLASTTTLWRDDKRLSLQEKQRFMDVYLQHTGFDQELFLRALEIYHPYLMLRALSWSAMALDQYSRKQKSLQNKEIYERVKSYLNPMFTKRALDEQVMA